MTQLRQYETNLKLSPMMHRPKVFIGSTKEALQYAKAIKTRLKDIASSTVWDEDIWSPGRATLENLIEILPAFDFAVLILTSDDLTTSRGKRVQAPRDNIIFELGLFMGHLGRFRTFFLCDTKPTNLKIPTDLKGITYVAFQANAGNPRAAIANASNILRREIKTQGMLRVFESAALAERIRMTSWENVYKRAIKIAATAESRIRATMAGVPAGLRGLKYEYIRTIAARAAEQKKRNMDFIYKAVCSTQRNDKRRNQGLLLRKRIFQRYKVLDCVSVRERDGGGRVDFLIVDNKHLHISFQRPKDRSLAFGIELEDAEKIVSPIALWFDECLFDNAKPINWDKIR